jgi:hypothetical protein
MDRTLRLWNGWADRSWSPLILAGYLTLAGAMFAFLQLHPSSVASTDVDAYLRYAIRIRTDGFAADFGNIRDYGYPLLLALISSVSGTDTARLALFAGLVQVLIYGAASFWLAQLLGRQNRLLGIAVLCGLLLNPYIISLVADAMSEAPSLICSVAVLCCIIKLQGEEGRAAKTATRFLIWSAFGSALACFSLMLRPANIVLLCGWVLGLGFICARGSDRAEMRSRIIPAVLTMGIGIAVLVWFPQFLYNFYWFHKPSILPTCSIGDLQLLYGIVSAKYETLLSHQGASAVYYPNPWYAGALPKPVWVWYVQHPISGLATIGTHVVGALTIDHLTAYRHSGVSEPVAIPLLGWAINASGLVGLVIASRENKQVFAWRADWAPTCIVVAVIGFGAVLLLAGAAVETRMALAPIACLSVAAVYMIAWAWRDLGRRFILIGAVGVSLVAGFYGTTWLRSLASNHLVVPQNGLTFHCFHSRPSK